ncbi:MAG: HAD hydrolase family protein [Bacteroidia bacterium]|nr:HAD hydrolase family protein [Bacteroidia bacterium]
MKFKERLKYITTVIMDVDGVLTDGKVLVMPDGALVRNLSSKDGYTIQLAIKKGIILCIMSGGNNALVAEVMKKAGVQHIFINQYDKLQCYKDFVYINNLKEEEIMYLGDDLPDWEVMKRCGLAACPADAAYEIKEISHYVSPFRGGDGFVRDVLEQLLRARDKWEIGNW